MKNKELIDLAEKNSHIPDEDIKKDILDTQRDIENERGKIGLFNGRFDQTREKRIQEMKEFIKTLKNILKGRKIISDKNK